MRITHCVACVAAMLAAPALASPQQTGRVPTDAEIRSGAIIDDGLEIPGIRPGTQYFEIHGSTRISRALGFEVDSLPTALVRTTFEDDDGSEMQAAW